MSSRTDEKDSEEEELVERPFPKKVTKVRDEMGSVTVPKEVQRLHMGREFEPGEDVVWYVIDGIVFLEIADYGE